MSNTLSFFINELEQELTVEFDFSGSDMAHGVVESHEITAVYNDEGVELFDIRNDTLEILGALVAQEINSIDAVNSRNAALNYY